MIDEPLIGIGLDAQYRSEYPYGIDGLCNKFRKHLTHISVVNLKNKYDALIFKRKCSKDLPIIQHLPGVAPADVDGPHLEKLNAINEISDTLNAMWHCEDIGLWSIGPYAMPHFAPPIFDLEVAHIIARGIKKIQKMTNIPFGAETPISPFIMGDITYGEFFHDLVRKTKCDIILDTPHVYSYAVSANESPSKVLYSLPLDHVYEIHVAGGRFSDIYSKYYLDTHSHPMIDDVMKLTTEAIPLCSNLQCITYEIGIGLSVETITKEIKKLEDGIKSTGWKPKFVPRN